MGYGEPNRHVTDDLPWPRKVKTVAQIHLSLNISKSLGDSVCTYGTPIGNCPWVSEWSRDRWRHVTQKVKDASPICLRLNISQTAEDSGLVSLEHLPGIGNYMVCIEWSCDQWRHVTYKGQGHDRYALGAWYFEILQQLDICCIPRNVLLFLGNSYRWE